MEILPALRCPTFSIIIPCLNGAKTLSHSIKSVLDQDFGDFELIVADGASIDDSVPLANSYGAVDRRVQIDSQPDCGVYDAINRGIQLARGAWIYILGSDDRLAAPDVLSAVAREMKIFKGDLLYGDVVMCGDNRWVPSGNRYTGKVDLAFLSVKNVCQQAIFYRRSTLIEAGCFESKYAICADWVFFLRRFHSLESRWIDLVICEYATTGLSSSKRDVWLERDFLEILGGALYEDAFNVRLMPLRHRMRECAAFALRRAHLQVALKLLLASIWLRVTCRLSRQSIG